MVRSAVLEDAEQIRGIYNHYVVNTSVTFEEEPVSLDEMVHRIQEYTKSLPWLVYEEGTNVLGYCYATKWRARPAYRHSVEITVYVDKAHGKQGIGTQLYRSLLKNLSNHDVRSLVAGIALPNTGSQALHEKFGFQKVAHFEKIGRKFDRWVDVGYWQYQLPEEA